MNDTNYNVSDRQVDENAAEDYPVTNLPALQTEAAYLASTDETTTLEHSISDTWAMNNNSIKEYKMNDAKRRILDMLAEGKINADEAERLLNALENSSSMQTPLENSTQAPAVKKAPRYLRVIVDEGSNSDGTPNVNVKIPLQILRSGIKLASILPPQVMEKMNTKLGDEGFPIDLSKATPEMIEELIEALADFSVNVNDGSDKVRVFCE